MECVSQSLASYNHSWTENGHRVVFLCELSYLFRTTNTTELCALLVLYVRTLNTENVFKMWYSYTAEKEKLLCKQPGSGIEQ